MSFPAYPKYKDSGAEWLGDIPIEWDVPALRRTVGLITEKAEGSGLSVGLEDIMGWSGRYDPKGADYESDGTAFNCGDVLYGKLRPYLAKVWAANTAGAAVGDFHVLRPTQITSSFLVYCLLTPAAVSILDGATHGAKMPRVSWGALADLRLPLPSTREQLSITAFIDRETAKIDAAVAAQQRLIALLGEKRAATISHAVTKGLDPDAPMKDSGIEWLGQIPAHWGKMPLRSAGDGDGGLFLDGDWIESKDLADEGIRYLTTGNVGPGFYKEQGSGYISEDTFDRLNCTEVYPGDVLVSRLNAPVGRACRVPDLGERIVTSVDNVIVRPVGSVDPHFLVYLLTCGQYFQHNDTMARGTTMQRVSRTILGNIRIPLPPLEEQRQIAAHLDAECADLDRLSAVAESVIYLLKERRAAIISAAVTGKIDVRGEVDLKEQEAA